MMTTTNTAKNYSTPRGPMTRDEIIARATRCDYMGTKGECIEIAIVRSYSPELLEELRSEWAAEAAKDPFAGTEFAD